MRRCCGVAVLLLTGATLLEARQLAICVDRQTMVSGNTFKEFAATLQSMESHIGADVVFDCNPSPDATRVYVLFTSRAVDSAALGASLVVNGKVTPNLVLYCETIRQYLPSKLEMFVGRAMARVAAHELIHYLRQSIGHEDHGIFVEALHPARLMAAPPRAD